MFRYPDYIFLKIHARMMRRRNKMTDKESLEEEINELKEQLEDCTAVNLENMKKVKRLESALDEIIRSPGGGPAKRIATQARG
jgi:chromosome segregation ATPase